MAYQSYGSYGSFSNIPNPNNARKYLLAAAEQSQQFQKQEDLVRQQQQSYLDVMRQKLRAEQQNRERNFQLEQTFRKQYQDAVLQNDNQRIENQKQQSLNNQSIWKTLSKFSETAGQKYTEDWIKAENQRNMEAFLELRNEFRNLPPEEKNALFAQEQSKENQIRAQAAFSTAAANDQALRTGEYSAKTLRDLTTGHKELIVQKAKLAVAAEHLPTYFTENLNTTFTVTDPVTSESIQMTYADAQERDPIYAIQIQRQMSEKIIHDIDPERQLDVVFKEKYYHEPVNRILNREQARLMAKDEKQRKEINDYTERQMLMGQIISGFSQTGTPGSMLFLNNIVNGIAVEQSSRFTLNGKIQYGMIRDQEVLPMIKDMVQSGSFDNNLSGFKESINNQMLSLAGGQSARLGDIKTSESLSALNQAFDDRIKQIDNETDQERSAIMESEVDSWFSAALSNDRAIDPEEIRKIRLNALRYKDVDPVLYQKAINRIEQYGPGEVGQLRQDELYNGLVEEFKNGNGDFLTIQQNSNWLTKPQRDQLSSLIAENNPEQIDPKLEGYSVKDAVKLGESILRGVMEETDMTKASDPSLLLAKVAMADLYRDFVKKYSDPNGAKYVGDDRTSQLQGALADFKAAISEGAVSEDSPFFIVNAGIANKAAYVKGFHKGGFQRPTFRNSAQELADLANDPSLLSRRVYVSSTYLAQQESNVLNGRAINSSPWVLETAKRLGKKPYEVLNDQFKAAGKEVEIKPGLIDELSSAVKPNPKLDELLSRPTRANVNAAIIGTNNSPAYIDRGVDAIQAAQVAGFKAPTLFGTLFDSGAFTFNNNGYPAASMPYQELITESSTKYGINPSLATTLMQIESNFNPASTSPTGAVGLMQIQRDSHPSYKGGYDPKQNIDYGIKYYKELLDKYKDPIVAAGAYNAGPGRMDQYLKEQRPLPRETVNHMKKFKKTLRTIGGSPLQQVKAAQALLEHNPLYDAAQTPAEVLDIMVQHGLVNKSAIENIKLRMGDAFTRPLKTHTGSQSTNPNFMSNSMQEVQQFITGSHGSGPHTDVKQMDNPNTPENEELSFFKEDVLDQYFVVIDPEYGQVGLNELRQKDDNTRRGGARIPNTTFYAPREGGRRVHRGYDYPTAPGSRIIPRPGSGARMLKNHRGQQIWELPDGRRFAVIS